MLTICIVRIFDYLYVMETKRVIYIEDFDFVNEIDEHIKDHKDLSNRTQFIQLATRAFLSSRKNKGNFTRIK